jgi:hypothetical protein
MLPADKDGFPVTSLGYNEVFLYRPNLVIGRLTREVLRSHAKPVGPIK